MHSSSMRTARFSGRTRCQGSLHPFHRDPLTETPFHSDPPPLSQRSSPFTETPPQDKMTDRCKNITLETRRVRVTLFV